MFCNSCGAKLESGQSVCPSCGKTVVTDTVSPPPASRLLRHLRLLGMFWIVLSVYFLLGAITLLIVCTVVFRNVEIPRHGAEIATAVLSIVGVFLLALAVGGFMAGWGLLKQLAWARLVALVMAFISLFCFPFGTALGVYTLWVLLPSEAEAEWRGLVRSA